MIASSHGPIYKDPERILQPYRKWTSGETAEKALVVYVSMWKSTEAMAKTMVETLLSKGIDASLHNPVSADLGDIAKDLVDSRAIVLGTPTVMGGMHPFARHAANLVKALRPPIQYGAVLSSYGWNGGAVREAAEILKPTRIEVIGTVEINGPPSKEDHGKVMELGRTFSCKIKGTG